MSEFDRESASKARPRLCPVVRAGLAALALAAAGIAAPSASAAFSRSDFDGDGVRNARDNCLVVANPGQRPGRGARDGAACSGRHARATIHALRFDFTIEQVDQVYAALPAGPMPGWGTETWGRVRLPIPGAEDEQANALLNDPLVPNLWQGQVFFTRSGGGHMYNRVLHDAVRTYQADVGYGPSLVSGGRAIVATYPAMHNPYPVSNIVLECRTAQTGIYFCYAWLFPVAPFVGPKLQLFYVFQDANPEPAAHEHR